MFKVVQINSEWPCVIRRFGVFLTIGQYGIRHYEIGIGRRRDGRLGIIRRTQYGNGFPVIRGFADVSALSIRFRRYLEDVEL